MQTRGSNVVPFWLCPVFLVGLGLTSHTLSKKRTTFGPLGSLQSPTSLVAGVFRSLQKLSAAELRKHES